MNAHHAIAQIRSRYGPDKGWCVLPEVTAPALNGTKARRLDAVAFGVYESNSKRVHGFEVKVSRSDWQAELADGTKSAPGLACTTDWWIVAPAGVVKRDELPEGWGLFELGAKQMRVKKRAKIRAAVATDWLYHRATKRFLFDHGGERRLALSDARREGRLVALEEAKRRQLTDEEHELIALGKRAKELEAEIGPLFWDWQRPHADAARALDKLIRDPHGYGTATMQRLERAAEAARGAVKEITKAMKVIGKTLPTPAPEEAPA